VWTAVIDAWKTILIDLEEDPMRCADRLDWVAKKRILDAYTARDRLEPDSDKLKALALQYHDIDPASGLYHRLVARNAMQRMFTDDEVEDAVGTPPTRTRAYFRGRCVSDFPDDLVAANWDSLVFDTGEPHLRRVPMMEPLRGTKDLVGPLLDRVEDASALIDALGG
jgi:proteasome accessory factor A